MRSFPFTLAILSISWLGYAATSGHLLLESKDKPPQPASNIITVTGEVVPNGKVIREEKICLHETLDGCVDKRIAQQVAKSDGTTEIYIEGTNPNQVHKLEGSLSSPLK